ESAPRWTHTIANDAPGRQDQRRRRAAQSQSRYRGYPPLCRARSLEGGGKRRERATTTKGDAAARQWVRLTQAEAHRAEAIQEDAPHKADDDAQRWRAQRGTWRHPLRVEDARA